MKRSLVLTLLLLIGLACTRLPAQTRPTFAATEVATAPLFWADILYFRAAEGRRTLAEVLIEVPYSSLDFIRSIPAAEPTDQPEFIARVEVAVLFDDPHGFQVAGNSVSDTVRTRSIDETESGDHTRLYYFAFPLEPGPHLMRVLLTDEITGRRRSSSIRVRVPSYQGAELKISSLQLAQKIEVCKTPSVLQKNGRLILPNVQHLFASQTSHLYAYFEAYNLGAPASDMDSVRVDFGIFQGAEKVAALHRVYRKPGSSMVLSVRLPLESLNVGEYDLAVTVGELDGSRRARAVSRFRIRDAIQELSDVRQLDASEKLGYNTDAAKQVP